MTNAVLKDVASAAHTYHNLLEHMRTFRLTQEDAKRLWEIIVSPLLLHAAWADGALWVDVVQPNLSPAGNKTLLRLLMHSGTPERILPICGVVFNIPFKEMSLETQAFVVDPPEGLRVEVSLLTGNRVLKGKRLICSRISTETTQEKPAPLSHAPTIASMRVPRPAQTSRVPTLRPPEGMSAPPPSSQSQRPLVPEAVTRVLGAKSPPPPRPDPKNAQDALRIADEQLARLHAPHGVDPTAETPLPAPPLEGTGYAFMPTADEHNRPGDPPFAEIRYSITTPPVDAAGEPVLLLATKKVVNREPSHPNSA